MSRGGGGGLEGTLPDRFEARNVECGVDPHGTREAEADRSRVDDTGNGEGTHETRRQLFGFYSQWQVTSGKPDLLPRGILRGWDAMPVGVPAVPVRGAKQSGAGLQPGAPAPANEGLD